MNKLELKHIVPYLPYQLTVYDDELGVTRIIVIYDIGDGECLFLDNKGDSTNTSREFDDIKLILRPLSELTKEVGKEHLFELLRMQYMNIKDINKCKVENDGIYYGDVRLSYLNYEQPEGIQQLRYPAIQYLFKYHFDVFGLIEKGLAIDKNTIE